MMAAELPGSSFHHVSVMLDEVVAALEPRDGQLIVDATLGGGGHTEALLAAAPGVRVIASDRDAFAVRAASERLAPYADRVTIVCASFSELGEALAECGVHRVDGLVADLGVSSPQLDDAERGMSFRREGPLDMRMDTSSGETAAELIDRVDRDELADIIFQLGEERRSRRIARCIVDARDAGELHTTADLRRAVVRAVGPRRIGGVDPATRTFQALRLAVNRELDELATLLELSARVVRPGGRVAFISFHSLEDRLVKRALRDRETWQRAANKPLVPSDAEQSENPRSRSAKFRAATRCGGEA